MGRGPDRLRGSGPGGDGRGRGAPIGPRRGTGPRIGTLPGHLLRDAEAVFPALPALRDYRLRGLVGGRSVSRSSLPPPGNRWGRSHSRPTLPPSISASSPPPLDT